MREHGRMVVSMPAGAPHPFLLETGGVALGSGHHFRPVPARTRRPRTRRIRVWWST